jgi:hypothetical protein
VDYFAALSACIQTASVNRYGYSNKLGHPTALSPFASKGYQYQYQYQPFLGCKAVQCGESRRFGEHIATIFRNEK